MEQSTAVNWRAYRVWKDSCGEPETTFGYYSTRARAEMEALKRSTDPMCQHESVSIEEIEIES